jgi:hypothetical protein
MATEPATAARVVRATADPAAWRAWYVFYHTGRERLVAEFVRPTLAALRADRDITRFYFVRYDLGGPHVRLRVKPAPGRAAHVEARLLWAAEAFLHNHPSAEPLSAEVILQRNAGIVASDPLSGGVATEVYPDNTIREFPVFFEVERYGGPLLFPHSLDFFSVSSREALRFVMPHAGDAAGQRLAVAGRLCVDQAWGFAGDEMEFTDLLGYASRLFKGDWTTRFVERGNEAFERQRAVHIRLLRDELQALAQRGVTSNGGLSPALADGARKLARRICREEREARWIISASHLHMTANRLGLLNPEELYLGQILSRATRELASAEPEFWRGVWRRRQRARLGSGQE